MAAAAGVDEEYETQFLGFVPSIFVEDVESLIGRRLHEALNQVEHQFSKADPDVLPEDERVRGMVRLRAEIDKNFSRCAHKLKTTLLNNFKVPPHVLHPSDLEQSNPSTQEEVDALKEELKQLRLELLNEKYMQARCKVQLKKLQQAREEQMRVFEGPLSKAEMYKEKLTMIRDGLDELQRAAMELEEETKDLMTTDTPDPETLLEQRNLGVSLKSGMEGEGSACGGGGGSSGGDV